MAYIGATANVYIVTIPSAWPKGEQSFAGDHALDMVPLWNADHDCNHDHQRCFLLLFDSFRHDFLRLKRGLQCARLLRFFFFRMC
jgi:hypothetical protein